MTWEQLVASIIGCLALALLIQVTPYTSVLELSISRWPEKFIDLFFFLQVILISLRPCQVTINQMELDAFLQGSCYWRIELYQFSRFSRLFVLKFSSRYLIPHICSICDVCGKWL